MVASDRATGSLPAGIEPEDTVGDGVRGVATCAPAGVNPQPSGVVATGLANVWSAAGTAFDH